MADKLLLNVKEHGVSDNTVWKKASTISRANQIQRFKGYRNKATPLHQGVNPISFSDTCHLLLKRTPLKGGNCVNMAVHWCD